MAFVRRFSAVLTLIAAMLAIAPTSHADTRGGSRVNPRTGLPAGFMPTHRQAAKAASLRATATPTPPNLQYWGGPVVTSAQVQSVLWGGSGSYLPEVSAAQGAVDINTITSDILHSEWAKGLSEFSTADPSQQIGIGSATGRTTITPSAGAASATPIDDSVIQSELVAQLNADTTHAILQAPTANTIYTLYFPSGTLICDAAMGSNQCSNNAFCAYHGSTSATVNGVHVLYVVQPYPDANWMSGCAMTGQTALHAMEAVTSHELSETITDPLVALASSNAPPLGWYDLANGEVADICQAGTGNWAWIPDTVGYLGSGGEAFETQQYWSNHYHGCVPAQPAAPRWPHATPVVGGRVKVTWTAPADDRRAPIQGYDIFQVTPTNSRVYVGSVTGTAWTSPNYSYGRSVTFYVDAWNNVAGGVDGDNSARVTAVAASTPSAVPWLRTLRSGTSPIVGWAAAPPNGSAITKYVLTGPGGTRTLSAGTRSFHWGYLPHGRYIISVRAVNALGYGVIRRYTMYN